MHARNVGHVIFSSTLNQPFSQYFCCLLIGNADFVRRNPIATKRVVRAMVRATDICASKPDWVARRLIDGGFAPQPQYDYVRQGLSDVPYRKWRDYDAEDSIRFYALRLHELGMIKATPDKIIAKAADWRFLNEVKQEMGIRMAAMDDVSRVLLEPRKQAATRLRNTVVSLVSRLPARVQTKLLAAFLAIVLLLVGLGAVGLHVLSGVNQQTKDLITLQHKIEAYRQLQHDTISQLYGVTSALSVFRRSHARRCAAPINSVRV